VERATLHFIMIVLVGTSKVEFSSESQFLISFLLLQYFLHDLYEKVRIYRNYYSLHFYVVPTEINEHSKITKNWAAIS
jgi:hypothetical protein